MNQEDRTEIFNPANFEDDYENLVADRDRLRSLNWELVAALRTVVDKSGNRRTTWRSVLDTVIAAIKRAEEGV